MKAFLLLMSFLLFAPSTLTAAQPEATPEPLNLNQELTEEQLDEILGGDICIVCSGTVTITSTSGGVKIECDEFLSISICHE